MHTVFSVSIVIILIAYLFKYKQTLLELTTISKFRKRKKILSLLVYILQKHETWHFHMAVVQ